MQSEIKLLRTLQKHQTKRQRSFQTHYKRVLFELIEGKLTSLEEFRVQKNAFEEEIKAAEARLKEKEKELPEQLERMERQTVLRIEE